MAFCLITYKHCIIGIINSDDIELKSKVRILEISSYILHRHGIIIFLFNSNVILKIVFNSKILQQFFNNDVFLLFSSLIKQFKNIFSSIKSVEVVKKSILKIVLIRQKDRQEIKLIKKFFSINP